MCCRSSTDFLAAFPEINVQLVLSDRNVDLVGDQIDLAVRIGAAGQLEHDRDARRRRCGAWSARARIFSRCTAHRKRRPISRALPCITFGTNCCGRPGPFASKRRAATSIPIRARLAVNTAEAALDAALAGVGLTQVLSYQAANAVKEKRLKIVLKEFETRAAAGASRSSGADAAAAEAAPLSGIRDARG